MIPTKKTKKEEAPSLPTIAASTSPNGLENQSSLSPIIEDQPEEVKAKNKKKELPKNLGGLTMESKVPNLSVKIYEEQLTVSLEEFAELVRNIDPKDYWVLAIIHDRDIVADEIFVPAFKKRHLHILTIKQGKDASGRADRRKVSTILSMLKIVFRPGLDDMIWAERGVERIHDLGTMVAYLTHETEKAEREGKEVYNRDEIISNLQPDEIDQLRDGYLRISHSKHKATIDEQIELHAAAYKAGYENAMTWRQFKATLPFIIQKSKSACSIFIEAYNQGVDDRMAERSEVLRLCVFIQGEHNQGKTYAAKHAFDDTGLRVREIGDGGKTGKMDDITEGDDVLVVDDATISDVLGMADNKVCKVYKRNAANPYWCGQYLVITSNESFEDWAKACYVKPRQMEAAKSRFYICQIVDDGEKRFLDCSQVSKRGTPEQQRRRLDMFLSFRDKFDAIIGAYRPNGEGVDYSALIGSPAASAAAITDKPLVGWFGSTPNKNGQLSLPDDPTVAVEDCLPFG